MRHGIRRTRRPLWVVVALVTALLSGCAADTATDDDAADDDDGVGGATATALPDWLVRVYPEPGAEASATQGVQVEWTVDESADQIVRLRLDGTDVTTHSDTSGGELSYAPEEGFSPVELSPGEHTAVAELVEVSATAEETVDTFEWTFTIL